MKKLMIAAAIVCAAAFTQAATVSWSVTDIADAPTTSAPGMGMYTMYCFLTSESSGAVSTYTTAEILAAIQDGTIDTLDDVTTGLAMFDGTAYSGVSDVINGTWSKAGDYASGTAIIIDSYMASDAQYYMAVDSGTVTGFNDNPDQIFGVSAAGTEWQAIAVPEPTSGLLLLLGVAGLALRRRRA